MANNQQHFRLDAAGHKSISTWFFCTLVFTLSGCASTTIAPDRTTYPVNQKREITEYIPIVPGGLISATGSGGASVKNDAGTSIDIADGAGRWSSPPLGFKRQRTLEGDSATHEVWVTPKNRREFSEKALIAKAKPHGSKKCLRSHRSEEHVVTYMKYYYGSEATLKLMSIRSPALKIIFRCAIQARPAGGAAAALHRATSRPDFSGYFDTHEKSFSAPPSVVSKAIKNALGDWRFENIETGYSPNGIEISAGGVMEKIEYDAEGSRSLKGLERARFFVMFSNSGSVVAFQLLSFRPVYIERGVEAAGTKRERTYLGVAPIDRKSAYSRSSELLTAIAKQIGSHAAQ